MTPLIERWSRPAIHLQAADAPRLSYLGGQPQSATDFEWPRREGRYILQKDKDLRRIWNWFRSPPLQEIHDPPLHFIAQLDIGELNADLTIDWLPDHGRLLFFYELDDQPWGFDPKDGNASAVIFDPGADAPSPVAAPEDLGQPPEGIRSKYLQGRRIKTYPDLSRIDPLDCGQTTAQEDKRYDDMRLEIYQEQPHHQIGGFPDPIQLDDMEEQCQLAANGIDCGDPASTFSAKAKELLKQPHDWRLLFQFDTDEQADIMWCDTGMLYFWIRESDARRRDFSQTWLILQSA